MDEAERDWKKFSARLNEDAEEIQVTNFSYLTYLLIFPSKHYLTYLFIFTTEHGY